MPKTKKVLHSKPSQSKQRISPFSLANRFTRILLILFLIVYVGIFLYLLNDDDSFVRGIIHEREVWVETNQKDLWYAFTEAFPYAEKCRSEAQKGLNPKAHEQCILETRDILDRRLHKTLSYTDYNRLPLFFIRLKDENNIEKLYQSGHYKIEPVDTRGERMVAQMLQGKRNPFAYPQYKCCGGDDLVADYPVLGHLLPTRSYLKDFMGEIELVFLMEDSDNTIKGAIVYHHGD